MRFWTGASILLASILLVPELASAKIPFFGPIIPTAYNVCAASWGLVIVVINNVIAFLITLAITIVAPLMIAWAGFEIITNPGSVEKRTQAKKRLTNTVLGIILALAAWMIVAALMAVLYRPQDPRLAGISWYELITLSGNQRQFCIPIKAGLHQTPAGNPFTGVGDDGVTVVPPVGPGYYTHEEAVAILNQHGNISVSSTGGCSDPTKPNCTSLHNIPKDAITRITEIQTACGCSIIITGGTEVGHASHGQQLAIVDFDYSAQLIEGIREVGYAINANFGRGATCEPSGGGSSAVTCGSSAGVIHMEF